MPDKSALQISDEFRQFLEAIVEEVVLEGKSFEIHKKYLPRFCQAEGIDHNSLEADLYEFFETVEELKAHESKGLERLLHRLAKECFLSDDEIAKLVCAISNKRMEIEIIRPAKEDTERKVKDAAGQHAKEETSKASKAVAKEVTEKLAYDNYSIEKKARDNKSARKKGREKEAAEKEKRQKIIENLIANMVNVEGGIFTMGATSEQGNDAHSDEEPTHQVSLSSFSIGRYEVTQEEWQAVMGNNPSKFKGAKRPVESVSWDDCQDFIRKLNALTSMNFRLPTEAEWEFSARGGNRSEGFKYSGSNDIDDVAWYDANSGKETHSVGLKSPNELGLYDMSGNVWEWCRDRYGEYCSSSQTNPIGPSLGFRRVFRGGCWCSLGRSCRVSRRNDGRSPDHRKDIFGFRLAL